MRTNTTSDRLKYLMETQGYKQIDIVNKAETQAHIYNEKYKTNIKFGRNDISQYVSGKVEPNQYKLDCLASALGVNPVWLMGFDTPMDSESEMISPEQFDKDVVEIGAAKIMNYTKYIVPIEKRIEILDKIAWEIEKQIKNLKNNK